MIWVVLGILLFFIFSGVPIGFSLMITSGLSMWLSGVDLMILPMELVGGTPR